MPSDLLKQTLQANRAVLAESIGSGEVSLYTADSATCSIEPCLNYQQCLTETKFRSASPHYHAASSSAAWPPLVQFRSIDIRHDFSCRCPTGFTGTNMSVTCDLEINLCYSNPCREEHGTCVSVESGYVCVCEPGWTGRACEFSLSEAKCCSPSSSSSTNEQQSSLDKPSTHFDRIR